MRIALVCSEFRPGVSLDLRSHARGLGAALARAGLRVEVFTLERASRERLTPRRRVVPVGEASGSLAVTALAVDGRVTVDEVAAGFGRFLDRERPALCHFEALADLGPEGLAEATRRGLPTVYCARDPWPAHDRLTLTLPDLSPFELGDCEAEARGEVAAATCGTLPAGGGAPAAPAERALLRLLLDGDDDALAARGDLAERVADARTRVQERRAAKRAALSAVDRRFAASRLLARQLSATVGRAFTPRLPGVEAGGQRRGAEPATGARTRVVFVGTSGPIEGVQLLLDALRTLVADPEREAPDVRIHLEATDGARDAEVVARAESLGAEVELGSGPPDVARALGAADALVLPALWGQFAPAPVRLAQAAGLPVVAAALPGLEEFVAPGTAVLVDPADADALAEALASVAIRSQRLEALREAALHRAVAEAGSGALKSLDAEAREWTDTYDQLVAASATAGPHAAPGAGPVPGPPHVEDFTRELAALGQRSLGDLFERVGEGLEQLRTAFGLKDSTASLMARAVARGGPLRDRAEGEDGRLPTATPAEDTAAGDTAAGDAAAEVVTVGDLLPRSAPAGLPVRGVATEADPAGQDEPELAGGEGVTA